MLMTRERIVQGVFDPAKGLMYFADITDPATTRMVAEDAPVQQLTTLKFHPDWTFVFKLYGYQDIVPDNVLLAYATPALRALEERGF